MVTVEKTKRELDRMTVNDPIAVQVAPDTLETTSQQLPPLNRCSRCGNLRPLTHRVRSDLVEQTVCEACAAEVPLVSRGIGALTTERIVPTQKS